MIYHCKSHISVLSSSIRNLISHKDQLATTIADWNLICKSSNSLLLSLLAVFSELNALAPSMSTPAIPRALPIEFVGDLEVLKPPLHRRQRKVR